MEMFDIYDILSYAESYLIFFIIGLTISFIIRICIAGKFGSIAKEKGYSFASHFLMCIFFGFIGWITVCALPDKKTRKVLEKIANTSNVNERPNQNWESE